MARHTMSHAVDLYSGEAVMNGWLGSNRGLPIDLLILDDLGAPAVADVNGYVVNLNVTGAGNFSLKTATGALIDSSDVGVADVARGVQIVSGGADTATLTITGTDKFGNALTEDIQLNGNTIVFGKKAFKKISQIATDGTTSNNINIGTSDLLGLTYRVDNEEDIVAIYEDGAAGRTARAAAAAAPAAVTAVAVTDSTAETAAAPTDSSAETAAAVTDSTAETAAAVTVTATGNNIDGTTGDGMDAQQITDINTLFDQVKVDFDASKVELDKLVTDMSNVGVTAANYKGEIDKLVTDMANSGVTHAAYKVEIDKLVTDMANVGVTSANYKGEIDKLVLDVAAQKVELDKLILDVDLGTVGSFKKAVTTAATATTGDVRGTYDPSTVLDGVKTIKILLRPQARTSRGAYGVAQA